MFNALAVIVSYFVGTFPSASIITRQAGIDVTTAGSCNPGTSNVLRLLGWRYGILVLVLDLAKGGLAVALAWQIDGARVSPLAYACAYAAVLGHIFPMQKGRKGGRGVATSGGAICAFHPILIPSIIFGWFFLRKVTGKSSVSSLLLTLLVPIYIFFVSEKSWEAPACLGLVGLITLRHLPNIRRLRAHQEPDA